MAYGTILGQTPTASNVSYNNSSTSSIITGANVQQAIDQLFTSVSNGKQQIASAITDKGVSTSGTDSFATMAENIGKITTGLSVVISTAHRSNYSEQLNFLFSNFEGIPKYVFIFGESSQSYFTSQYNTLISYTPEENTNSSNIEMRNCSYYTNNDNWYAEYSSRTANFSNNYLTINADRYWPGGEYICFLFY